MSKSNRDRRAWKYRNSDKWLGDDWNEDKGKKKQFSDLLPNRNFPEIAWSIAGKRRRGSSRKSNQKAKPMQRRLERARNKAKAKKEIKEKLS